MVGDPGTACAPGGLPLGRILPGLETRDADRVERRWCGPLRGAWALRGWLPGAGRELR